MKRYLMTGAVIVACVLGFYERPNVLASRALVSFASVSGYWSGHGRTIDVGTDGLGIAHFRTYTNCTQTVTTNCDMFVNQLIYPGGYFSFRLNAVAGSKAFGSITASGYSWMIGTRITIARNSNDTVRVYVLKGYGLYCGTNAPVGACGA